MTYTPSSSGNRTGSEPRQINVMLVDDSAVIRGALSRILEEDKTIHIIASVANGEMAVTSAARHKPHIIIMDVEMPVMDGITALPKVLKASPDTKVIMFSTLTEKGASVTMEAMKLGAVECLVKPSSTQSVGSGSEFQGKILNLLKSLVPEEERTVGAAPRPPAIKTAQPATITLNKNPMAFKGRPSLIAIGSSTGGPQALFKVLGHLKGVTMPIVITQHMPATFTKILAEHIKQQTGIPSQEGAEGTVLKGGEIYVAPGGFHMLLKKNEAGQIVITLDDGPQVNFCKPAVDPMFQSAVKLYGNKVLGLILTGMGNDGLGGGRDLVQAGGRLIAQDEKTSVVWGMPGAVAKDGICTEVLPLEKIGPWLHDAST